MEVPTRKSITLETPTNAEPTLLSAFNMMGTAARSQAPLLDSQRGSSKTTRDYSAQVVDMSRRRMILGRCQRIVPALGSCMATTILLHMVTNTNNHSLHHNTLMAMGILGMDTKQ
jgi:hypothetical protein